MLSLTSLYFILKSNFLISDPEKKKSVLLWHPRIFYQGSMKSYSTHSTIRYIYLTSVLTLGVGFNTPDGARTRAYYRNQIR